MSVANNQESYEAVKKRIEVNMLWSVIEDIVLVAPELADVNKLGVAYYEAKDEVFRSHYEKFYLGGDPHELITEGAVEFFTASALWWKYCGGSGLPCPADAFREECEELMKREDEEWLRYVVGRVEQDGLNEIEVEEDEMDWE